MAAPIRMMHVSQLRLPCLSRLQPSRSIHCVVVVVVAVVAVVAVAASAVAAEVVEEVSGCARMAQRDQLLH